MIIFCLYKVLVLLLLQFSYSSLHDCKIAAEAHHIHAQTGKSRFQLLFSPYTKKAKELYRDHIEHNMSHGGLQQQESLKKWMFGWTLATLN